MCLSLPHSCEFDIGPHSVGLPRAVVILLPAPSSRPNSASSTFVAWRIFVSFLNNFVVRPQYLASPRYVHLTLPHPVLTTHSADFGHFIRHSSLPISDQVARSCRFPFLYLLLARGLTIHCVQHIITHPHSCISVYPRSPLFTMWRVHAPYAHSRAHFALTHHTFHKFAPPRLWIQPTISQGAQLHTT